MSEAIRLIQIDGKTAYIKDVPNALESLKDLIGGGYLESFPFGFGFIGLCDEDGLMKELPKNPLGIAGLMIVSKYDSTRHGELGSLTDDDIKQIERLIAQRGIYFSK
ncbi:hypothetical protein SIM22_04415 [Bacillus cereus group sp. BfR-BA-01363]|uniref:DUF3846 domain-containing protein n=1 Tax=Bacillus cereus group sp. BfR-BA-01363 TaxID=3094882 RepID=UPI0029C3717A|nr:hypothetical protein [Bacillus cereus group sp. BfR-BA-01363]MDX5853373.1 hypothetical protein [Bacillus cereus group sp. BfR-BA-01363]